MRDVEEQNLIDKLRAKYSSISDENKSKVDEVRPFEGGQNEVNMPQAPAEMMPSGSQRGRQSTTAAQVKACSTCQGMGEVDYIYNNRCMKRQCDKCEGEGTFLYRNGVLEHRPSDSHVPRASNQDRLMTAKQKLRVEDLKKQVAMVRELLASCEAEREQLMFQLKTGQAKEEVLSRQLVEQLDERIASLKKSTQVREDRLSYYDHLIWEEPVSTADCSTNDVAVTTPTICA